MRSVAENTGLKPEPFQCLQRLKRRKLGLVLSFGLQQNQAIRGRRSPAKFESATKIRKCSLRCPKNTVDQEEHPRLIPHHMVVGEHLLYRRARQERVEFSGSAREKLPVVGDDRRTGCAVRRIRRASGEQARYDREDDGSQPRAGHVGPRQCVACACRARHCGRPGGRRGKRGDGSRGGKSSHECQDIAKQPAREEQPHQRSPLRRSSTRAHSMTPMPISVTARRSPFRRIEVWHHADERLVRLTDGLLNSTDRSCANRPGGGHLPALDRPRLLQPPLGWRHPGAGQRASICASV